MLLACIISFHSVSPIHSLSTLHHKHCHDTSLTLSNSLVPDQNICQVCISSYLTFILPLMPTNPTLWYKQQLWVQRRYRQIWSNICSLSEWLISRHSLNYNNYLFAVVLFCCFYECHWMEELVLNNDVSLRDWHKIIKWASLHFFLGCWVSSTLL
jgi:hypothetical protein